MNNSDQSQRFLFEDHPIRGQHVSLDQSWQEIAQHGGVEGRGELLNCVGGVGSGAVSRVRGVTFGRV
jgi:hypothetical protein